MDIRYEEGVPLLLIIEVLYINPVIGEIRIKLGLLGEISLVDLFVPERVFAKMLPVDPLDRILLEEPRE